MKALILAAGYATRLYPLTKDKPKPLLPVAGKPMLQYIMEKIELLDVVDEIYLVTNAKFAKHFEDWISGYAGEKKVTVFNDQTVSDDDKLGAVGDIQFVIDKAKVDDDLLVIAGDNLFEFNLGEFVTYFEKKKENIVALHDIKDKELVKRYSVVELNEDNKLIHFEEKPKDPKTSLIAICCYVFPRHKLSQVKQYIANGGNPDAPGYYLEWLYENDDVYAYVFSEQWFDIGGKDQLEKANVAYRGL